MDTRSGYLRLLLEAHGLRYRHWKTMSFIAALRCDRIEAPFVCDQPIDEASFAARI